MFERFSDRARKVMALANQEAQRFNHEYIDTEHILLGLVAEGSGVGVNVLKNLDVDLRKVRLEVEKLLSAGPEMVTMGKLPQSPPAKKVINYAVEEARSLNHNYVGTEHLLLGLLRERDGVAAQVLMNLGLKLEEVREEVVNFLASGIAREVMGSLGANVNRVPPVRSAQRLLHLESPDRPDDISPGGREHELNSLPEDIDYIQSLASELSRFCVRRESEVDTELPRFGTPPSNQDLAELLSQPCSVLRLAPHESGALSEAGLARLIDLVKLGVNSLNHIPGIGGRAVADIRSRLRGWGLDVGMSPKYVQSLEALLASERLRAPVDTAGISAEVCSRLIGHDVRLVRQLVRQTREGLAAWGFSSGDIDGIELGLALLGLKLGTTLPIDNIELIAALEAKLERVSILKDDAVMAGDYDKASVLRDEAEALRKEKEALQRAGIKSVLVVEPVGPHGEAGPDAQPVVDREAPDTRTVEVAGFSRLRFLSFRAERAVGKHSLLEAQQLMLEIRETMDRLVRAEARTLLDKMEQRMEAIEDITAPGTLLRLRAMIAEARVAGDADIDQCVRRIDEVDLSIRAAVKRKSSIVVKCGAMTRGLRDLIQVDADWRIRQLEDELKRRRAVDINDYVHEKYKKRIPIANVRLCFFSMELSDQSTTGPLDREMELSKIPHWDTEGLYWYPEIE